MAYQSAGSDILSDNDSMTTKASQKSKVAKVRHQIARTLTINSKFGEKCGGKFQNVTMRSPTIIWLTYRKANWSCTQN